MSRPAVEVADVLHAQGDHFLERHPWLSGQQRTVLRALQRCRTAALGGHLDQCGTCGHRAISYNSCRNRHCPKCQAQARERWLAARERELLNVPYVHVVFTLPHALDAVCQRNAAPRPSITCSFAPARRPCSRSPPIPDTSAPTSGSSASSTRGAKRWAGIRTSTASSRLAVSLRIAGDGSGPKSAGFFLPVKVLSRVFRGKFVEGLRRAYACGELDLAGGTGPLRDPVRWRAFVDALCRTDWVVYAKPAFGGPAAALQYLGRYTHRVAISNHRLIAFDGERVTFRWKDDTHDGQWRTMTAHGDGVSPALRAARAPTRLRAHSAVWLSGERVSHRTPRPRPRTIGVPTGILVVPTTHPPPSGPVHGVGRP